MRLTHLPERADWRETAEKQGFNFHTMYGAPYWNESRAYAFSLDEIESRIEDPSTELHAMCLDAAERILASEDYMSRMGIPRAHWDLVANSFRAGEPDLYGRFDLAYDGAGPAKLLEYNADTPTSLFESTSFQWDWLQDRIEAGVLPPGSDQFNGAFEAIAEAFRGMFPQGTTVHFACVKDNEEDYGTTETIGWAAKEAGLNPLFLTMDQIGVDGDGRFVDMQDAVIERCFKLYPWEDLLREDFARYLSGAGCQWIEPPWKALLSNKAILPFLWLFNRGHDNLLPAYFDDDALNLAPMSPEDEAAFRAYGDVTKPIFSREGGGVTIHDAASGEIEAPAPGPYDAYPKVRQLYRPLPVFDGMRPVIGAWIVKGVCVGMGLREDAGRVTGNLSQFIPHYIEA